MIISLLLTMWIMISVIYAIMRLGYKHPSKGIRKYLEYLIYPPVLLIAIVAGGIGWILKKPRPPVIVTGTWEGLHIKHPKKYHTQIRINGEKGKYWIIDVSSDEPMTTEVHE